MAFFRRRPSRILSPPSTALLLCILISLSPSIYLADPNPDCGCSQCDCCPPGQYNSGYKTCACCPAGSYMDYCNYGPPCKSCPAGHFCPIKSPQPTPCAAGTYNPNPNSASAYACVLCPARSYCSSAALHPAPCPDGMSSSEGAQSLSDCHRISPLIHSCSWSQTALSTPRSAAAAASLPPRDAFPSGLLLFAGGVDASTGTCSAAVDIFNPQSKLWTTALLSAARCSVAAAALPLQVPYSQSHHPIIIFKFSSNFQTAGRRDICRRITRRRHAQRPC